MEAWVGSKLVTDVYITDTEQGKKWSFRPEKQTFGPYDRYENMYLEFADIILGKMQNPYSYEYEKLVHETLLRACGL